MSENADKKQAVKELVDISSAKYNTETARHQHCKRKLDKATAAYTTAKKNRVGKHRLPLAPPPEQKKHTRRLTADDGSKMSPLKVSLKRDLKILASLRSRSVGTNTAMTITEEEEQILDLVKSAGLTLEGVRKITDEIKDDNKIIIPKSEMDMTKYSNKEREFLEKIREGLFQLKNIHKKESFPFLYYLSLDSHDCVKSLFCLTETNEDVSQLPLSSNECILKALKDTMVPETLQKVRKFLRDHIIGIVEVYDRSAAEQRKFKATPTQTEAHLEGCSTAKKVKSSSAMPSLIAVRTDAVYEGVRSNAVTATNIQSAQRNLLATQPVSGTAHDVGKGLEKPVVAKQMNTHKVLPPFGRAQNNNALPQVWVQPPVMYSAQSTGLPQSVDHRWNPNNWGVDCYPYTQWNTHQY